MTIPLYLYINFIAIVVWLLVKRKIDKDLGLLALFLVVMFFIEMSAWVYSKTFRVSNHWIYNILTIFEILYLCFVYRKVMAKREFLKYDGILIIAFLIFSLFNLILIQGLWKFNTYTYLLGCVVVFFYFIRYLKGLLDSHEIKPLHRVPYFWITLGNILFFSGSFFYMGAINYILEKMIDRTAYMLSSLVYSFAAIQYCLFVIGFICNLKQKQKYSE